MRTVIDMSEKTKKFKLQSIDTFSTLILSAFSLVAALAWNEAIKEVVAQFIGTSGDGWVAMIIYAVIVTILAVIVILAMNAQVAKLKAGLEDDE